MRIDPSHICRKLARLSVRADHCRECDHEVCFGDTICAYCGARDPVRLPGWVSTIIIGFAVVNVISLAGRVLGATSDAVI